MNGIPLAILRPDTLKPQRDILFAKASPMTPIKQVKPTHTHKHAPTHTHTIEKKWGVQLHPWIHVDPPAIVAIFQVWILCCQNSSSSPNIAVVCPGVSKGTPPAERQTPRSGAGEISSVDGSLPRQNQQEVPGTPC